MTTREFTAKLDELSQAIYEEKDLSTVLQFLHRLISETQDAADLIGYDTEVQDFPELITALEALTRALHNSKSPIIGAIQALGREKHHEK